MKIPNGKVLAHLGFRSKVVPGPWTDICAWVGFCTSSPQQGVNYHLKRQVGKNFAVGIVSWDIYRAHPLSIKKSNPSGQELCCWDFFMVGLLHLKPTAGCQISTLTFKNNCGGGGRISHEKFPTAKCLQMRTWGLNKRYFRAFNWLKCLCGFLYLKPTTGCQLSTLIFDILLLKGEGLYKYLMKNSKRQSSCPLGD